MARALRRVLDVFPGLRLYLPELALGPAFSTTKDAQKDATAYRAQLFFVSEAKQKQAWTHTCGLASEAQTTEAPRADAVREPKPEQESEQEPRPPLWPPMGLACFSRDGTELTGQSFGRFYPTRTGHKLFLWPASCSPRAPSERLLQNGQALFRAQLGVASPSYLDLSQATELDSVTDRDLDAASMVILPANQSPESNRMQARAEHRVQAWYTQRRPKRFSGFYPFFGLERPIAILPENLAGIELAVSALLYGLSLNLEHFFLAPPPGQRRSVTLLDAFFEPAGPASALTGSRTGGQGVA